jgi:signal transduction histidine kinase
MSVEDTSFSRVVSLACHDLRTPLATVLGFARTLRRSAELEPPADRYVDMIDAAAGQMTVLLDDLALLARVTGGRWDPALVAIPVHELAASAAEEAEAHADVVVSGRGEPVAVERAAVTRALTAFTVAAARHGGASPVELRVVGTAVTVAPVRAEIAPILLGADLRDFGSAVGVATIRALGGDVEHTGETLLVRLPRAADAQAGASPA